MAKIILITHQKGGVGKSTLTFNLAVNLSDIANVCIVDFDFQGSLNSIKEISKVPIFNPNDFEQVLQSNYDFVFIDTPPYLSENLPKLCKMADIILIPSKVGYLDVLAIRSTIQLIESVKQKDKAMVVFNMVKANTSLTSEVANELQDYNIKISKTMISDLVAFTRSILVNGIEKTSNAQRQIDSLTQEILNFIIHK